MLPPGMPGDKEMGMPMDNTRLYQVLNLPRTDVTPEEIKRAYRKTAARVHPDRNRGDDDATQRFQDVQYAYSVLSDPQLRSIYDSYGEQGLKMYESYMSFAESDGSAPYLPVGNPVTLITFLCIGVGLLVALATALCVDLYLKLQGISNAPLSMMLIPLWILNALAAGLLYVLLVAGARKGAPNLLHPASRLTQLLLLIAWEVLVVLRTDGDTPSLPYVAVFGPLFALELISDVRAFGRLSRTAYDAERASGRTLLPYGLHVTRVLFEVVSRAACLVLIVMHLDKVASVGWTVALLPIWCLLALDMALACLSLAVPPTSEREQMTAMLARGQIFALIFLGFVLLLVNLILTKTLHSWLPIFIFFFIASGCFFCCCCCAICALRMSPRSQAQEVPPRDDGYGVNVGLGTDRSMGSSTARSDSAPSPGGESPNEDAPLLMGQSSSTMQGRYRTGALAPGAIPV